MAWLRISWAVVERSCGRFWRRLVCDTVVRAGPGMLSLLRALRIWFVVVDGIPAVCR